MIPILPAQPSATPPAEAAVPARDLGHYLRPGTLQLSALPPLSLYVHLPWCLKQVPLLRFQFARAATRADLPEQRYLDALMRRPGGRRCRLIWGRTVHSVFIGGGTPSLFAPAAIDRLLGGIRARAAGWRPTARSRWRPTPGPLSATASGLFALRA